MLRLKNITKNYLSGETSVEALKGLTVSFRKNEFVSILGPSGCGKTTLLNVIGGLDQYTNGDLVINGKSTKSFTNADWDSYRNHSIGFIFQSYNLIPHQTVLSNVELALTLSGVSRSERRKRAVDVLKQVGLGDQLHKKPNQMSGGQMQRVAIARALVNNPKILLADEPTGALDSATSVQIMNLLQEVAKDRLVIMVTHNPDLAEQYSTRIIRLLDGNIIDDSNPYHPEELPAPADSKKKKREPKTSMSFFTALSLSLNNLLTKKTRTLLTSFAGSIGIIGIALILSVSTGVQLYIDRVQEDTLSSYPITIQDETMDISGLITNLMDSSEENAEKRDSQRVYTNAVMYELLSSMSSTNMQKNNLVDLKKFLEQDEDVKRVATLQYSYTSDLGIYATDVNGDIVKADYSFLTSNSSSENQTKKNSVMSSSSMMSSSYQMWQELLPGKDGQMINPLLEEQYDVIYGTWPQAYNEVVLIVNQNNEISDMVLYALGLNTKEELKELQKAALSGEDISSDTLQSWSFEEICSTELKMILPANSYQKQSDGTYLHLSENSTGLSYLYNNSATSIPIKISGIIRANEDAISSMVSSPFGYTSALTDYIIKENTKIDVVQQQLAQKNTDVLSGLPFQGENTIPNEEKIAKVKEYFASLNPQEKADLFIAISSVPSEDYLNTTITQYLSAYSTEQIKEQMVSSYAAQMGTTDTQAIQSYIDGMSEEDFNSMVYQMMSESISQQYAQQVKQRLSSVSSAALAAQFDVQRYTDEQYLSFFEDYLPNMYSESTYENNLNLLGYVNEEQPSNINMYVSTFEDKDIITDAIARYNQNVSEDNQISYTDYVALIMSSVSTIINAISYVLIAFVAISLVVSSIMIGIITYISVLERTKEIGILRAIGASKKDISRVFNAETLTIGFISGIIGIGATLLLTIPINLIIHKLTDIAILNASLPVAGAIVLVIISMFLTFIAGLIPSGIAAKKDPVVALRTE